MKLNDLPTPTALIDHARLMHNITRMQTRLTGLGVRLRPHAKTAKCPEVAALQRAAGAVGITVSTLKEAEMFFDAGHDDILYAVCIVPHKLAQARALRERGCRLTVLVDSLLAAQAVVDVAGQGHGFEVMIEIDSDGHRAGVKPADPLLLQIGTLLHHGGATLRGVMTHAGASYACRTPAALQAMAEQERSLCVDAADRLRAAGLPCTEVSVGSTPTALSAQHLNGVTEVRAGVYVFQDLVIHEVGVCHTNEIALSVLCSVIGHQAAKGWVLVDAGWMAMSRDLGASGATQHWGYGAVCDSRGALIPGLVMDSANQEHGILVQQPGDAGTTDFAPLAQRYPIGTRLRVLPNHACATAAQFPSYAVLAADGSTQTWPRFYGW